MLARHVALAEGADPSFAAAPAALLGVAARLGVRTDGAVLRDASGLARGDRLPVRTLLDLLGVAADPARPELSSALAGLPARLPRVVLLFPDEVLPAGAVPTEPTDRPVHGAVTADGLVWLGAGWMLAGRCCCWCCCCLKMGS